MNCLQFRQFASYLLIDYVFRRLLLATLVHGVTESVPKETLSYEYMLI